MERTFFIKAKNEKGLTLIELLTVIIILGIFAAIAIPATGKMIENSRLKAVKSEALIVIGAADLYFSENFEYDPKNLVNWVSIPKLISEGYMDEVNYLDDSAYASDWHPTKICAGPYNGNEITFYNATAKEIADSGKDLHIGKESCGNPVLTPP